MENMKMIKCIKCGADMPELRLSKFGYKVCVNCSTTNALALEVEPVIKSPTTKVLLIVPLMVSLV